MLKKLVLISSLAVVLGLVLACGTKKDADFIVAGTAEPETLDPTNVAGISGYIVTSGLFEGLINYDPNTSEAVPGIASSWDVAPDQLSINFHLRPNLKWSDGVAINAQTVYDSWIHELDHLTAAPKAYFLTNIIKGAAEFNKGKGKKEDVGIKVIDDLTFHVELKSAIPYAVPVIAHYAFGVLPLHVISKYGKDWTKPEHIVVNGPYTLKEWKTQQYIILEKNPKYREAANTKLNRIKVIFTEDSKTAYNLYKNGEIDWLGAVPLELMDEVKLRKDYHSAPNLASYYFGYNVTVKPLNDVRVRKAIAMAIDKQTLIEKVTKADQQVANTFVTPMPNYTAPAGLHYDVAEAQKLLKEAGFPDGKGFPKLTILYNTSDIHKKIVEFVQAQLATNLHITVELQNQEMKTYLQSRNQHQFQIARAQWGGDYLDPMTFLELLQTGTTYNSGLYSNPKFDQLLVEANNKSGAERLKLLNQAEDIAITQDAAIIPIYYVVSQNLIDTDKWGGWSTNPLNYHPWQYIYKK